MLSLFDGSECQNERALRFEFVILKSLEKLDFQLRKICHDELNDMCANPSDVEKRIG